MARPVERLKPIGFWSYARQDDEMSDGQLSRLRFQLAAQLQLIYGKQAIKIFQDVAAIPPGAEWERAINAAIDQATFFIPILTPAFVESEWCCKEVKKFLEREAVINAAHPELQGKRRIFPIRYIQSRYAEPFDASIVAELARLQETDFTALQRESNDSANVRDKLVTLADALADVLLIRVQRPPTAEELAEEARQRAAAEDQRRIAEANRQAEERRRRDEEAKRAADEEAARAEAERLAQAARERAEREAAEARAAAERAERARAAQQASEDEEARLAAEKRQREQADAKRAADKMRAAERAAAWGQLRARAWEWRFALAGAAIACLIVVVAPITTHKPNAGDVAAVDANDNMEAASNAIDAITAPLPEAKPSEAPGWPALLGSWALEGATCADPVIFAEADRGRVVTFAGETLPVTEEFPNPGARMFRAGDGAEYRLDRSGNLSRLVGKDAIRMTKCGG